MKQTKNSLFRELAFLSILLLSACGDGDKRQTPKNTVKEPITNKTEELKFDIEVNGNEVRIGDQVWMTKNLAVKKFRNGDPIFEKTTNPEWERLCEQSEPIYGFIMNKPEMEEKYGLIYNWYAVNDPRGLAPEGWRIPTEEDWIKLIEYLGGELKAGMYLKSTTGWSANGNGNNLSGFSALPGGFMGYYGESYQEGFTGGWWTSTEVSEYFAKGFSIVFDKPSVMKSNGYKFDGFSVRCIKE
jgi:uncharacterized protein (TIGR02145 family)